MSTRTYEQSAGCLAFVVGVACAVSAWRFCAMGPPWLVALQPVAAVVAWVVGAGITGRLVERG